MQFVNSMYQADYNANSFVLGRRLHKTYNTVLAKEITKTADTSPHDPFTGKYILIGGCLLHEVVWSGTYKNVDGAYVVYAGRRYCSCVVVIDGYHNGPTIKDHEHTGRATLSAHQQPPLRNICQCIAIKALSWWMEKTTLSWWMEKTTSSMESQFYRPLIMQTR